MVDAHAVAEQAVTAQVPEADVALEEREGVLVVAAQCEVEAAGADAAPPGVGQRAVGLCGDVDHALSFLNRSWAWLCRSMNRSMFLAFNSLM